MRNARWILLTVMLAGCANNRGAGDKQVLHGGYDALAQQDYNAAMASSEQFLKNNPSGGPGTAEALYLQGRVYENRAQQADAAGRQPEARADLQDARTTYEHALTLKPSPKLAALLHAGFANAAYFQEDYYTAMREWASAYPGLSDADARAWVMYRLGLCQQRLGRFEEADQSFRTVREQFPRTEPSQRAAAHQGARGFYVQLGAFTDPANADRTLASLRSQNFPAVKSVEASGKQAVRVGPVNNYDQAKTMRARLLAAFPDAIIEP